MTRWGKARNLARQGKLATMNTRLLPVMAVAAVWMATPAAAAPAIPVNVCGQNLDNPGAQYVLPGNLDCMDMDAVIITAPDIRFSLNGFTLNCVAFQESCGGIVVLSEAHRTRITGGVVTSSATGIKIEGATGVQISGVTISAPGGILAVGAHDCRISGNIIVSTTGVGLPATNRCRVLKNGITATSNGVEALRHVDFPSDNVIRENTINMTGTLFGRVGIRLGEGTTFNTVQGNTVSGGSPDLQDLNPGCGTNDWKKNTFTTSEPAACIK